MGSFTIILLSEINAVSELATLISAQVSYFTSSNVSHDKGVVFHRKNEVTLHNL
jgi:hypothetical protein